MLIAKTNISDIPEKYKHRFWGKVKISGPDECWEWLAGKNSNTKNGRYGKFGINNKKHILAHRMAYAITKGDIPDGLLLRHICNNSMCCNPDHLEPGTHKDNSDDMMKAGRQVKNPRKGSRVTTSKLTENIVSEIRRRVTAGEKQNKMAHEFGVSRSVICVVVSGKTWKHVKEVSLCPI